jgi:hypothetical protein
MMWSASHTYEELNDMRESFHQFISVEAEADKFDFESEDAQLVMIVSERAR